MSTHYYEIINPSDKVVLSADESDELLVAIAVVMLGSGRAGVERDDGKTVLPLTAFGGFEEWLASNGLTSDTFGEAIHANRSKIAAICETVFYGSTGEAQALDAALETMPRDQAIEARARYNDKKRSSLNDWGSACLAWAAKLRKADRRQAG